MIAALSGIPWHDAAGACARTSPERRHAVPSKSQKKCEKQKSENRVKKVVFAPIRAFRMDLIVLLSPLCLFLRKLSVSFSFPDSCDTFLIILGNATLFFCCA